MDKDMNLEKLENDGVITGQNESADQVVRDSFAQPYVPCFTEASENYRLQNDKKIREQLGIADEIVAEKIEGDPDEFSLDATAEFEEDVNGSDAKEPENVAEEDSDESISIYKFESMPEEELDAAAQQELAKINQLLYPQSQGAPVQPVVEAEPIEESEPTVEDAHEPETEEIDYGTNGVFSNYSDDGFGVYDYTSSAPEELDAPEGFEENGEDEEIGGTIRVTEYTNPTEREKFKDKFLDSLMSQKIRGFAAGLFAFLLLLLEILSATGVVSPSIFPMSKDTFTLSFVDFLLATGIFVLSLPETFRAFRYLFRGKPLFDLVPLISFLLLGGYTLAVYLTGSASYALFGFLFAVITIPVMNASGYRTKADFIAFKMISKDEDKQVIDKKPTRELDAENMALDGYVDEYSSKTVRSYFAEFISGFFANSAKEPVAAGDVLLSIGIPFGIGLVGGVVAFFLAKDAAVVTALGVFAITFMLGCPAFSALASKISFFHSQRAALKYDSTAIGEGSYRDFAEADVITFNDVDIFGPDDVNLKRFMLYGDSENMEKVMSQMCALFAAVGGPLDFIFSNVIDYRMRHKTATNLVIEHDGLCGDVMGHRVYAGSEDYMRRNNIAIPESVLAAETVNKYDTTKVMYAAEDGELNAKFYIRYSFSEEFTMILPELRESEIIPLIYTRDPNISDDLLRNLTASGYDCMRVCRLYTPIKEEKLFGRVRAGMITYGDKVDVASTVLLARRYKGFSLRAQFAQLCAMLLGVIISIVFSIVGVNGIVTLLAALWQIVWCMLLRMLSYNTFLRQDREQED